jgi:GGDEF domain-containing protein
MSGEEAEEMLRRLERETRAWRGRLVSGVTLSVGHALASECEDGIAERLVREADLAMYAAKAAYYRDIGRDRRQR